MQNNSREGEIGPLGVEKKAIKTAKGEIPWGDLFGVVKKFISDAAGAAFELEMQKCIKGW